MENFENMPRPEIVAVADAVAREKNIDKEDVFTAMEIAIQKAGRTKYGVEHDIRARIDRKTGAIALSRYREVVANDALIEKPVSDNDGGAAEGKTIQPLENRLPDAEESQDFKLSDEGDTPAETAPQDEESVIPAWAREN